jgi:hypothetical protein
MRVDKVLIVFFVVCVAHILTKKPLNGKHPTHTVV